MRAIGVAINGRGDSVDALNNTPAARVPAAIIAADRCRCRRDGDAAQEPRCRTTSRFAAHKRTQKQPDVLNN